ncbi:MAG TPA: hypothetical protein ENI80_00620 [Acidiferrobacteraceae bacterium]|nr:hypothetical protein [Acidiferrobacteraceae bacterium]
MRPLVICLFLLAPSQAVQAKGLPRAESCGSCHVSSFDAWQYSAHANSINSNDFRGCLEGYLEKENTNSGAYCFKCHAPGEVISGDVFAATSDVVKGKTYRDGVTCVVCHSVESVENGKAVYDPGDIHGYHSVKDLRLVNREALCSTCHSIYKTIRSVKERAKPGFFQGLFASLGGLVGTKNKAQTDHRFAESVVANEGHWACPDTSFSKIPPAEGQRR